MVAWSADGNTLAGTVSVSVGGSSVSVVQRVLRGSTWRPPVSVRNAVVEVPGRHGSVVSGLASLEPPTVTLMGSITAPSEDALEAALARLQGTFSRPSGVTLTRTSGLVTASASARLLSWTQGGDPIAKGVGHARSGWTAVLTVPGVTFRGTVVNSASLDASGNFTHPLPTLAGSSAPIRDAILQLSGPATSFSWTCPQSGTGISWAGTLLAGSYLYVDTASLTAWISTSATAWTQTGTDQTSRLDYPAAGPLQLWPKVSGASTVVEVAITGGGRTVDTDLVVRAAPTYL